MANYATLKTSIEDAIKPNGNEEIKGQVLQNALIAMIESLGAQYQFAGIATPGSSGTNPEPSDYNVIYIAGVGTYPNFGGTVVPQGSLGIFRYNGEWIYSVIDVASWANASNKLYYNTQAGSVAAKTIDATGFSLIPGGMIKIHFDSANTAENPTLNVNNTGAHQMTYNGDMVSETYGWKAGETVWAYYDSYGVGLWHLVSIGTLSANKVFMTASETVKDSINNAFANIGMYFNSQLPNVAAKTITAPDFKLVPGGCIKIKFSAANTAAEPTLNVNNTGAKIMIYKGLPVSATNSWKANETVLAYYNNYMDGSWELYSLDYESPDFLNVNAVNSESGAYATAALARAAVPLAYRKPGLNITYLLTTGTDTSGWVVDEYIGSSISDWAVADKWKTIGPVSVTQNTSTGHTDINIGSITTPVASVEEVDQVIGLLPKDSVMVNNPDYTAAYIKTDGTITANSQYAIVAPITLQNYDKILLNKGESFYHGTNVAILFKCDASGNFIETIIAGTGASKADYFINKTGEQMFVGLCSYKENRSYIVDSVLEIASKDSVDELSIRDGLVAMVAADNPASSSAKVIAKPGFIHDSNNVLIVRLYPSNTADNLTLNINNTGDYPLYYNGFRANSSNCWIANEFALLAVSSEAYYLTSFNVLRKDQINELIVELGVTNDVKYNRFLKELYLTGLNENSNYRLTVIRKDASATGKYGLYIGDDGHYSVDNAIAFATMDYVDGKTTETLIQIKERNSSGISGYAVVDWSVITSTGYISLTNVILRNIIITDVNYQPRIASYIKDAEQDVAIARNTEGISVLDKKGTQTSGDVYVLANDIKTNRPYFLNDTYSAESAFADTSYLDAKLREIPEGKHFIFTTDSHIDYYRVGLSQKETEIMDYVKTRLNAGAVIFGGDCVGQAGDAQHTDPVYSYQAAKILSVYANDKFNAFGEDFLWCQGNHDANANLNSANKIPSTEIFKRTTGIMARYGKAVFDEEGIELINALTAQQGETEEEFTEKKAQMVAWFKLHYYYDDYKNKIRFIVIETGDGSNGLGYLVGSWDGYTGLVAYLTFIADALKTCPDTWDAVLVMHQMSLSTNFVDGVVAFGVRPNYALYEILSAFKQKSQITVLGDGSVTSSKPYLYSLMQSRIGTGKAYDFGSRTSGRCFAISGHFHFDDCWVIQNENTSSVWNYRGKEYGQWDSLLANAILHIQLDRACLYNKGAANAGWPNAVSYPNQGTGEGDEVRTGTKNEVLFDVVTITPDNKVICTRIGAGSDRIFDLPTQS